MDLRRIVSRLIDRFHSFITLILAKIYAFIISFIIKITSKLSRRGGEQRAIQLSGGVNVKARLSNPINLLGYLLEYYCFPIIMGILLTFLNGLFYTSLINKHDMPLYLQWILLFGSLSCLVLIVAFVAFLKSIEIKYKLFSEDFHDHILPSSLVHKVAHQMPWSVLRPDIEDVSWIAQILKILWPYINEHVSGIVREKCHRLSLSRYFRTINQLAGWSLETFNIGSNVPNVTGVHVFTRGVGNDQLVVESEVTYDSDLKVITKGNCHYTAGIEQFYFQGKVRLVITLLISKVPVVSNIEISMLQKPTINWKCCGLLKFLNWFLIKDIISLIITYFLVAPYRFKISIGGVINANQEQESAQVNKERPDDAKKEKTD